MEYNGARESITSIVEIAERGELEGNSRVTPEGCYGESKHIPVAV